MGIVRGERVGQWGAAWECGDGGERGRCATPPTTRAKVTQGVAPQGDGEGRRRLSTVPHPLLLLRDLIPNLSLVLFPVDKLRNLQPRAWTAYAIHHHA